MDDLIVFSACRLYPCQNCRVLPRSLRLPDIAPFNY